MIRRIQIRHDLTTQAIGPRIHLSLPQRVGVAATGPMKLWRMPGEGPVPAPAGTTPELAGADVLGWGYDVFGGFADPGSCRQPVLDLPEAYRDVTTIDGKRYRLHSDVSYLSMGQGAVRVLAGMTLDEYRSSLRTEVNLGIQAGLFGGQIETIFSHETLTQQEYAFSHVRDLFKYYKLSLQPPVQKLATYLDPDVLNDAKRLAPEAFFNRYGTHVVVELVMGGSCLYASSTLAAAFTDVQSLAIGAKASYLGVSGQASAATTTERQRFDRYSETNVFVAGGDPKFAHDIATTGNYQRWLDSLSSETVQFVDFTPQSLIPIWDLLNPVLPNEASRLAAAWPAYAIDRQLKITPTLEAIRDFIVISGDGAAIQPPAEYVKIAMDVNRKAGGKYIYFCYRKTRETAQQVTDIVILDSGKAKLGSPPPQYAGWTMDPHDLNEGAGGDYIYALYRKGAGAPITGLAVVSGPDASVPPPPGYARLNVDLNKGAGGDYIYLCISRTPGILNV